MAQQAFSVFAPALTALEAITYSANKGVYATGADAFALYDLTAGGRALGGVAGTADTFPYFSASNVVTLATITAAGRALMDDASASAQRTTLGVDASRLDPTNPTILVDDFCFGSTESGEMGGLGWGFTNGAFNLVNPEANHPGMAERASTAVAGVVASTFSGGGGTTVVHQFGQFDEQTWVVKPKTADTDFDIRVGLASDLTANPPTNGVYFEKLAADTNWFAVARISGVQTRTDLGVAFAADWIKVKIRRIDASTVGFTANALAEIQIATNVPLATNTVAFGFQVIPGSANARSLYIDFFSQRFVAQTR